MILFYILWYLSYLVMFLFIITFISLLPLSAHLGYKINTNYFTEDNKYKLRLWRLSILSVFILCIGLFYLNKTLYNKAQDIYFEKQEPIYTCGLVVATNWDWCKQPRCSSEGQIYNYHVHIKDKKALIKPKFHKKLELSPYSQTKNPRLPIIDHQPLCLHYKKRPTTMFLTDYSIIITDIFPTH